MSLPLKANNQPRWISGFSVLLLVIPSVAIWWRNRDILRDLYDYSVAINAVGKIAAGLKPYSDVRSPLQPAMYLLNTAAETVFGHTYLGLTWGGLVQVLGGGLLLRALAIRPLGTLAGTCLALAVALAGLSQHVIFWHNPIAVLCLALVLVGLADTPRLWPVSSWRTGVILGALFMAGITKLSFLAVTLALGALLVMAAWSRQRISGRAAWGSMLLLVLFGLVLPLGFELAWTQVSLPVWYDNVVGLPSKRRGLLQAVIGWRMYVRPIHDFHHHVFPRCLAGVGLFLLLATALWLCRDAVRQRVARIDWLVRVALVLAGLVAGAVLLVTNMEIVVLTSLVYPLLCTALWLVYRPADESAGRGWGGVVVAALLLWSLSGGYAAWHGARVLWGHHPPPRSEYVRVDSRAPALQYFKGVRMLPAEIAANELLAARLRQMETAEGTLRRVLFGPGLEWLERAYPQCVVRHEPLWYDDGITLGESDAAYFAGLLAPDRQLVAQEFWEHWPASIRALLDRDYTVERLGARDVIYRRRQAVPPAIATQPGAISVP